MKEQLRIHGTRLIFSFLALFLVKQNSALIQKMGKVIETEMKLQ